MKKLERMVKKAVASIIDIEIYGWPPVCIGMIYQPERPQMKPSKAVSASQGEKHAKQYMIRSFLFYMRKGKKGRKKSATINIIVAVQ